MVNEISSLGAWVKNKDHLITVGATVTQSNMCVCAIIIATSND